MAAAFYRAAWLNMHEGVANHFSLAENDDGTQFLINPFARHFARIKAQDLLLIDAKAPGRAPGKAGGGIFANGRKGAGFFCQTLKPAPISSRRFPSCGGL